MKVFIFLGLKIILCKNFMNYEHNNYCYLNLLRHADIIFLPWAHNQVFLKGATEFVITGTVTLRMLINFIGITLAQ